MPTSADTSGNHPPATVLTRPDHRIYVTTGSHLMMEHPLCDDLLDRLDEILYRAAFRDGDPFMVAPPLDESRNGRAVPLDRIASSNSTVRGPEGPFRQEGLRPGRARSSLP